MPQLARANPHLRLTAAILVAVFAALAGSLEADPSARGRRGECQTVVGGIRLVAVRSGAVHDHQRAALPSVRAAALRNGSAPSGAQARADARARLDRSRPAGAALLRTTALPPPVA